MSKEMKGLLSTIIQFYVSDPPSHVYINVLLPYVQVALSTWSGSSVKVIFFYPMSATACPQNRHVPFSASEIGASSVFWKMWSSRRRQFCLTWLNMNPLLPMIGMQSCSSVGWCVSLCNRVAVSCTHRRVIDLSVCFRASVLRPVAYLAIALIGFVRK